jgi:hypothetical protein
MQTVHKKHDLLKTAKKQELNTSTLVGWVELAKPNRARMLGYSTISKLRKAQPNLHRLFNPRFQRKFREMLEKTDPMGDRVGPRQRY